MPIVSNFKMLFNPNNPLPAGANFRSDPFDLPSLAEGPAVLLFRYQATNGRPTLEVQVNNNDRVKLNLVANGDASCSFHETILGGQLTERNNRVTARSTGTGEVVISDIVVMYPMEV